MENNIIDSKTIHTCLKRINPYFAECFVEILAQNTKHLKEILLDTVIFKLLVCELIKYRLLIS